MVLKKIIQFHHWHLYNYRCSSMLCSYLFHHYLIWNKYDLYLQICSSLMAYKQHQSLHFPTEYMYLFFGYIHFLKIFVGFYYMVYWNLFDSDSTCFLNPNYSIDVFVFFWHTLLSLESSYCLLRQLCDWNRFLHNCICQLVLGREILNLKKVLVKLKTRYISL